MKSVTYVYARTEEYGDIVQVKFPDGCLAYMSKKGVTLALRGAKWKKALAKANKIGKLDVTINPAEWNAMVSCFQKGKVALATKYSKNRK